MIMRGWDAMTIRLIASDLDGTLYRDDKTISERTKNTLAEAAQRKICFVPVTGRSAAGSKRPIYTTTTDSRMNTSFLSRVRWTGSICVRHFMKPATPETWVLKHFFRPSMFSDSTRICCCPGSNWSIPAERHLQKPSVPDAGLTVHCVILFLWQGQSIGTANLDGGFSQSAKHSPKIMKFWENIVAK